MKYHDYCELWQKRLIINKDIDLELFPKREIKQIYFIFYTLCIINCLIYF